MKFTQAAGWLQDSTGNFVNIFQSTLGKEDVFLMRRDTIKEKEYIECNSPLNLWLPDAVTI